MFDILMSNVFIQSVHIYIVYNKMIDVYLYNYVIIRPARQPGGGNNNKVL